MLEWNCNFTTCLFVLLHTEDYNNVVKKPSNMDKLEYLINTLHLLFYVNKNNFKQLFD